MFLLCQILLPHQVVTAPVNWLTSLELHGPRCWGNICSVYKVSLFESHFLLNGIKHDAVGARSSRLTVSITRLPLKIRLKITGEKAY